MSLPDDKDKSPQLSLKALEPDELLGEVPAAPAGIGRRELLMRSALVGAVAVITGRAAPAIAAEGGANGATKAGAQGAPPPGAAPPRAGGGPPPKAPTKARAEGTRPQGTSKAPRRGKPPKGPGDPP